MKEWSGTAVFLST